MKQERKKIKDTNLGKWLAEKAPSVLGTVGDLLPDQGALGIVKNLLDKEPGIDPVEAQAKIDAEVQFQNNVTERWKADMGSDVKLAKLIRPMTLICLMVMFMATMIADSMDAWPFNVKDSYVSLLEILMLTSFGAYFAGRTIRKNKEMRFLPLMFLPLLASAQQGWVVVTLQADQYSGETSWLISDESGFVGEESPGLIASSSFNQQVVFLPAGDYTFTISTASVTASAADLVKAGSHLQTHAV